MATIHSFVEALESRVAGLLAELAVAKAEAVKLVNEVDDMTVEEFQAAWDAMEREYAPLFGIRGIHPEIPRYWMPVIIRLASRLRADLTEAEYRALEITGVKEKFGMLAIGYYADSDTGVSRAVWDRVAVLVGEAEEEAQRIEAVRKRLS